MSGDRFDPDRPSIGHTPTGIGIEPGVKVDAVFQNAVGGPMQEVGPPFAALADVRAEGVGKGPQDIHPVPNR